MFTRDLSCLQFNIMFIAVSDYFSSLNNVIAYFLPNSGSKFIARVLQLILYPANKIFSWWTYRHCNAKSQARAAHERKRERGSGVERPCHFPALACSLAAGFARHSKWNCLLAGRQPVNRLSVWRKKQRSTKGLFTGQQAAEVVTRENTLRRHPGNEMSGNVGCFLRLVIGSAL